jgi:hypothetical protein
MDQHRYHALTRTLTCLPSRRDVLRGLTGVALGLGVARLPEAAHARKKRKRKRRDKKATPNAFGCLSVGKPCKNADQCCAGICEGKKGKRTCRAHGTGTCNQKVEGLCTSLNPASLLCNNSPTCVCFGTTADSRFCVDAIASSGTDVCTDCKKDADCEALGFPAGSACVPTFTGGCAGGCESGMACLIPCPPDVSDE